MFLPNRSVRDKMLQTAAQERETEELAKKSQILKGAREVFLAEGYYGASMSLIARAAGVSKGTLYVYFSNKQALFAAFIEKESRLQSKEILDLLDMPGPADEVLTRFGRAFLEFQLLPRTMGAYRVLIAESPKFPELGRAFYEAGPKMYVGRFADFLRARIGAGELDIDDPVHAAIQFLALCKAELVQKSQMHVIDTPTPQRVNYVIQQAVRMFMKAYRAD